MSFGFHSWHLLQFQYAVACEWGWLSGSCDWRLLFETLFHAELCEVLAFCHILVYCFQNPENNLSQKLKVICTLGGTNMSLVDTSKHQMPLASHKTWAHGVALINWTWMDAEIICIISNIIKRNCRLYGNAVIMHLLLRSCCIFSNVDSSVMKR